MVYKWYILPIGVIFISPIPPIKGTIETAIESRTPQFGIDSFRYQSIGCPDAVATPVKIVHQTHYVTRVHRVPHPVTHYVQVPVKHVSSRQKLEVRRRMENFGSSTQHISFGMVSFRSYLHGIWGRLPSYLVTWLMSRPGWKLSTILCSFCSSDLKKCSRMDKKPIPIPNYTLTKQHRPWFRMRWP